MSILSYCIQHDTRLLYFYRCPIFHHCMATISIKYQVLKPNFTLTTLISTVQNTPATQHYQLVTSEHTSIRKYSLSYQHHKDWLQLCEWRFQAPSNVVKCLYVDMLKGQSKNGQRMKEVYVQHMEINLSQMRKISTPEAVYLLVGGLKGFTALLEKMGRVEVKSEGIGIDKRGNVIVWLSQRHEELKVQDGKGVTQQWQIVCQLIELVKGKCEFRSGLTLGSLLHYANAQRPSTEVMLTHLHNLINQKHWKPLESLRHMLVEQRLSPSPSPQQLKTQPNETPRFSIEKNLAYPSQDAIKTHPCSFGNCKKSALMLSFHSRKMVRSSSAKRIQSHRHSTQYTQPYPTLKQMDSIKHSNSTMNTLKSHRTFQLTQPNQHISIITARVAPALTKSKNSAKNLLKGSQKENSKPYHSNLNRPVTMLLLKQNPKLTLWNKTTRPEGSRLTRVDDNLLWNTHTKINTSITLGPQTNTHFQDVKLEKLDQLSRKLAISKIPQQSEPQSLLFSQHEIE